MNKLFNKTALVTGGSEGIGFAIAQSFAVNGANVIITGRDQTKLNLARQQINGKIETIQSDASNLKEIDLLFQQIKQKFLHLDCIVLNAGTVIKASITETTEAIFDQQIDLNFKGVFFTAQKSIPFLNNKASIIFISSAAAILGIPHISVYSATKAAEISLAQSFAAELAPQGIRSNVISPGTIDTPLARKHNAESIKEVAMRVPLEHRLGQVNEIANAALYLASDDSSYMTGQNLIIDGGISSIFV